MSGPLKEIASVALRLGCIAFGGPAAHIALMQHELVERRKWLGQESFLDFMALTQLIPGPNSTELMIHLGYHRGGTRGLMLAGWCFLLPACLLSALLGALYVRYGQLPAVGHLLAGVQPVVLVLIARALWKMGKPALHGPARWLIFALVAALALLGLSPVGALLAGGGLMALATARPSDRVPAVGLIPLFAVFLQVGSVLFGSGYVLVAFLEAELVEQRGWLTQAQLMDAIAAGQLTPGPLLSTSSFIGMFLAGPWGAVAATVGMFLPSFVFVALLGRYWPRMQGNPVLRRFLDGAVAGSVALLAVALVRLGWEGLRSPLAWLVVAVASALWTWKPKLGAGWVLLGGALVAVGWQWMGTTG